MTITMRVPGLFALAALTAGCEENIASLPQWDGLAFSTETQLVSTAPEELSTRVLLINVTLQPKHLEYGACSLELRAYTTPARTPPPVWTSLQRWDPLGFGYACPLYLATATLGPGDTLAAPEFSLRIPLYEIVGDGLGTEAPLTEGHYYFGAILGLINRETPQLAAGDAMLYAKVDSLPAARAVDGVRYEAKTKRLTPDSLQLSIVILNNSAEPVEVRGSRSVVCPTLVTGYSSALRRDTWYRYRDADWVVHGCVLALPPVRLAPEKQQTFVTQVSSSSWNGGPLYPVLALWVEQNSGPMQRIILSGGVSD